MTKASIADPVTEHIKANYGPADLQAIDRAIALFEDDALREEGKIDIMWTESGHKVWAYQVANVWISFVEEPELTITWVSVLSRFRYQAF